MKVNAKLGGTTCKVANPKTWFSQPTMIIGKSNELDDFDNF
jgi:eukaryotic translation initiation factor 2C